MAGRWRTKSIEQAIADTDDPDTQLRKDLSWWHLCVFGVSVVIAGTIGCAVIPDSFADCDHNHLDGAIDDPIGYAVHGTHGGARDTGTAEG